MPETADEAVERKAALRPDTEIVAVPRIDAPGNPCTGRKPWPDASQI
jgi:hypothetical protein